jgi:hypothetical protein
VVAVDAGRSLARGHGAEVVEEGLFTRDLQKPKTERVRARILRIRSSR